MNLRRARYEARRLLHSSGVRHPDHIDVEEIARAYGVEIVFGKLDGAMARVMRFGSKVRIRVSDRITNPGAIRFSIAHELGHLVLGHEIPTEADVEQFLVRACTRHRGDGDPEVEANAFAAELLMPRWLVRRLCEISPVDLRPVHRIADDFRTSVVASAVRFAELTHERCAAVYSEHGSVKWMAKSPTFPWRIQRGTRLNASSLAFGYFTKGCIEADPRPVPANTWLAGLSPSQQGADVVEHAELVPELDGVLSLVWIPGATASRLGFGA